MLHLRSEVGSTVRAKRELLLHVSSPHYCQGHVRSKIVIFTNVRVEKLFDNIILLLFLLCCRYSKIVCFATLKVLLLGTAIIKLKWLFLIIKEFYPFINILTCPSTCLPTSLSTCLLTYLPAYIPAYSPPYPPAY